MNMYQLIMFVFDFLKIAILLRIVFGYEVLFKKSKTIGCCITILLGAGIQYFLFRGRGPLLFYILILCVGMILIFSGEKIRIILIVMSATNIIGIFDSAIKTILTYIIHEETPAVIVLIEVMSNLFSLFLLCIIVGVWKRRKKSALLCNLQTKQIIYYFGVIMLVSLLFSTLGVYLEKYQVNTLILDLISLLFVCCIILLINVIVYLWMKKDYYQKIGELNHKIILMQKQQYEYLAMKEEDTKRLRHDYKHHMDALLMLCQQADLKKVISYLQTLQVNNNAIYHEQIETHHVLLNSILRRFESESEVNLEVVGHMPFNCYIDAYDIVVIFFNVLENASEAVRKVEDKKIYVELRYNEEQIFIVERNGCERNPKMKDDILTGKKDKKNHGFGVKNIRKSVERYNGIVEIEKSAEEYQISIMLYNFA